VRFYCRFSLKNEEFCTLLIIFTSSAECKGEFLKNAAFSSGKGRHKQQSKDRAESLPCFALNINAADVTLVLNSIYKSGFNIPSFKNMFCLQIEVAAPVLSFGMKASIIKRVAVCALLKTITVHLFI